MAQLVLRRRNVLPDDGSEDPAAGLLQFDSFHLALAPRVDGLRVAFVRDPAADRRLPDGYAGAPGSLRLRPRAIIRDTAERNLPALARFRSMQGQAVQLALPRARSRHFVRRRRARGGARAGVDVELCLSPSTRAWRMTGEEAAVRAAVRPGDVVDLAGIAVHVEYVGGGRVFYLIPKEILIRREAPPGALDGVGASDFMM